MPSIKRIDEIECPVLNGHSDKMLKKILNNLFVRKRPIKTYLTEYSISEYNTEREINCIDAIFNSTSHHENIKGRCGYGKKIPKEKVKLAEQVRKGKFPPCFFYWFLVKIPNFKPKEK